MMNKIIGFFASKCTGFTPSSTPPCGGALTGAVGAALAAATDDIFLVLDDSASPKDSRNPKNG
jgi:hypothetical protein